MVARNKLGKVFFCFKKYPTPFPEDFVYFFNVGHFHRETFICIYDSLLSFSGIFYNFPFFFYFSLGCFLILLRNC